MDDAALQILQTEKHHSVCISEDALMVKLSACSQLLLKTGGLLSKKLGRQM